MLLGTAAINDNNKKKNENAIKKITLSVKELAERWDVSVGMVYSQINDGTIPTLPIDGAKRILLTTVEEIEYNAGIHDDGPRTMAEKRLEQKNREYERKLAEISNLMLDMHQLALDAMMKAKNR